MKHFILQHIAVVLFHMGGFGLILLGVLDSSFLTMPLGNDLLVIALSAHHHTLMPYYAAMATAGSVIGCLLMDWIGRKGGEEALEKHIPQNRMDYIKDRVTRKAGWALGFASLMPPPFPFTPFVIAAAALEYPRKKLLAVIGAARFVRFLIEGALAIRFGKGIMRLAQSPAVEKGVIVLIVASLGLSALSITRWVKRSKQPAARKAEGGGKVRTAGGGS